MYLETVRRTLVKPKLCERYTPNWVGREEKWLDQDLCPCEGSQGEKRDYTGGHPPWVVSSSSHRWVPLVLGSSERETSPLAGWRTTGPNRMAVGSLIPPKRSTPTGLPQRQVERGCSKGCWISSNHLAVNPSLSVANTSTPLTPRHIAALDLGWPWLGQGLDHGT